MRPPGQTDRAKSPSLENEPLTSSATCAGWRHFSANIAQIQMTTNRRGYTIPIACVGVKLRERAWYLALQGRHANASFFAIPSHNGLHEIRLAGKVMGGMLALLMPHLVRDVGIAKPFVAARCQQSLGAYRDLGWRGERSNSMPQVIQLLDGVKSAHGGEVQAFQTPGAARIHEGQSIAQRFVLR